MGIKERETRLTLQERDDDDDDDGNIIIASAILTFIMTLNIDNKTYVSY